MSTTNTRTVDKSSSDDNSRRQDFNTSNIAEFRATGGKIASFGDAPVLLLTSIGAKSGAKRVNPMMYLADAHDPDRLYVFASKAGADTNPAWLGNLVAHPQDVTVEIGSETLTQRGTARRAGTQRDLRGAGRALSGLRRLPGQDQARDPRGRADAAALVVRTASAPTSTRRPDAPQASF